MIRCACCLAENRADDAEACSGCGASFSTRVTPRTVIASRYEVSSLLGRGGKGTVYEVRDTALGLTVALRILRPDIARSVASPDRLRTEIERARRVTHPNVCQLYGYVEDGDLRCVSMELIAGKRLGQLVRERPLSRGVAHDYALQIAAGLRAVHDAGIVHGNVKAANIMLDHAGVPRLLDFGIAGAIERVVGTPEYMSPEQSRGEPLDERSDVYSLGVVLFEIFTGHVPFHGDSPAVTLTKHLNDPPPLGGTCGVPLALVPVVRKALAKSPQHRFQSVAELIEALEHARAAMLAGAGPARSTRLQASPSAKSALAPIPTHEVEGPTSARVMDICARIARDATPWPESETPARRSASSTWFWIRMQLVLMAAALLFLIIATAPWEEPVRAGPPSPEPIPLLDPRERAEIVNADGCVRLTWAARPVASYKLRVARDAWFDRRVVAELSSTNTLVELHGLRPGGYSWQVWAEGSAGRYGQPMTGRFLLRSSGDGTTPEPFLNFDVEQQRGAVLVSGRTEPGAAVVVNGSALVIRGDGSFSHAARMGDGQQQVTVRAVAPNCGVSEQTRAIVMTPDEPMARW